MAVPLLDLKRQYQAIRPEVDRAIGSVIDHCGYILGPDVKRFESEIAAYCGVKHAIGVASGTDALLLSLRACGVDRGDEVITSDFSFFASSGVISRLGARPVFIDIDPETFNLDAALIEEAITSKTKAIIPVHLFGQCADMDPIMDVARSKGLKVIEDAAQAIGGRYKDRQAGSIGDCGCFSFFPTKNLGCAGDGGMVITNDDELADQVRLLRVHGSYTDYHHELIGYNSRLDTVQAALLSVKLPYLKEWTEDRRRNAARYDKAFQDLPLQTPKVEEWAYHIYNQYTIATDRRDELAAYLKEKQVGHKIYYPVSFHRQECFANLGYDKSGFPRTVEASQKVMSLPIFGEMTDAEQAEVIETIGNFFS